MLKRVKAIIAYDGSCFIGWQKQIEGLSVQSAFEEVVSKMHKKQTKVVASGRTDRGVNAYGQVIHFDTELNLDEETLRKALNAQLHEGIFVRSIEYVEPDFHARKSAKYKIYQYRIGIKEYNLFLRHQVFYTDIKLDINLMIEGSKYLIGSHDFGSFNTNPYEEIENQVRTIFDIRIEQIEDEIVLTYIGSGFMRYMVRILTQTLIEVGSQKIKPDDVKTILEAKDKTAISYMAKPQGLTLIEVGYEEYNQHQES